MLEHLAMVEKVRFSLYYLIVCSQRSRQQYRVLERSSLCFDVLGPESKDTSPSIVPFSLQQNDQNWKKKKTRSMLLRTAVFASNNYYCWSQGQNDNATHQLFLSYSFKPISPQSYMQKNLKNKRLYRLICPLPPSLAHFPQLHHEKLQRKCREKRDLEITLLSNI